MSAEKMERAAQLLLRAAEEWAELQASWGGGASIPSVFTHASSHPPLQDTWQMEQLTSKFREWVQIQGQINAASREQAAILHSNARAEASAKEVAFAARVGSHFGGQREAEIIAHRQAEIVRRKAGTIEKQIQEEEHADIREKEVVVPRAEAMAKESAFAARVRKHFSEQQEGPEFVSLINKQSEVSAKESAFAARVRAHFGGQREAAIAAHQEENTQQSEEIASRRLREGEARAIYAQFRQGRLPEQIAAAERDRRDPAIQQSLANDRAGESLIDARSQLAHLRTPQGQQLYRTGVAMQETQQQVQQQIAQAQNVAQYGQVNAALQRASVSLSDFVGGINTVRSAFSTLESFVLPLTGKASPNTNTTYAASWDVLEAKIGTMLIPMIEELSKTVQNASRAIDFIPTSWVQGASRMAGQGMFGLGSVLAEAFGGGQDVKRSFKGLAQPSLGTGEQFYEKMQLQALGQGPLELELLQIQMRNQQDLIGVLNRIEQNTSAGWNPFR